MPYAKKLTCFSTLSLILSLFPESSMVEVNLGITKYEVTNSSTKETED